MSDYTFSFIIENITLHLFIRNHILNVKIFLLANNKAIKAVKTHFKTDDQTFFLAITILDRYLKFAPQVLNMRVILGKPNDRKGLKDNYQ